MYKLLAVAVSLLLVACSSKQVPATDNCGGFVRPTAEERAQHMETFGCPPCPCDCVGGEIRCAPCRPCGGDEEYGEEEAPPPEIEVSDVPDAGVADSGGPVDAGPPSTTAVNTCEGWKPPTAAEKAKHVETFGCPVCPCACRNGKVTCAPCAMCRPSDKHLEAPTK